MPKRIYTIQELRLNKLEPEKLLSPEDVSLNTVRNIAQGAAAAGLVALAYFAGGRGVLVGAFLFGGWRAVRWGEHGTGLMALAYFAGGCAPRHRMRCRYTQKEQQQ